ncbi:hypothetical protein HanRHA438_Chr00c05g0845411 [Helianthus annuus]|nr:hypothetical protein HanRHA438_Chr00c05g0845411 [Helianthus annuus]
MMMINLDQICVKKIFMQDCQELIHRWRHEGNHLVLYEQLLIEMITYLAVRIASLI